MKILLVILLFISPGVFAKSTKKLMAKRAVASGEIPNCNNRRISGADMWSVMKYGYNIVYSTALKNTYATVQDLVTDMSKITGSKVSLIARESSDDNDLVNIKLGQKVNGTRFKEDLQAFVQANSDVQVFCHSPDEGA